MKSQIKVSLVFLITNIVLLLFLPINLLIYGIAFICFNSLLIWSFYIFIKEKKYIDKCKKNFDEKNKDKKFIYLNKEELKALKKQGVLIKDNETIYKENIQEWQIKN